MGLTAIHLSLPVCLACQFRKNLLEYISDSIFGNQHIDSFYVPGGTFEDEGPWEHDKTKTVVHVTTQFSDMHEFTKLKYYKDGVWKSRSEAPGSYYDWKNEAWVLNSEALWKEIRQDRNQ